MRAIFDSGGRPGDAAGVGRHASAVRLRRRPEPTYQDDNATGTQLDVSRRLNPGVSGEHSQKSLANQRIRL